MLDTNHPFQVGDIISAGINNEVYEVRGVRERNAGGWEYEVQPNSSNPARWYMHNLFYRVKMAAPDILVSEKMHTLPRKSKNAATVRVGESKYQKTRFKNSGRIRIDILPFGINRRTVVELTEAEVDDLIVMLEYQKAVSNGTIS